MVSLLGQMLWRGPDSWGSGEEIRMHGLYLVYALSIFDVQAVPLTLVIVIAYLVL
jgi:hypothetical protein